MTSLSLCTWSSKEEVKILKHAESPACTKNRTRQIVLKLQHVVLYLLALKLSTFYPKCLNSHKNLNRGSSTRWLTFFITHPNERSAQTSRVLSRITQPLCESHLNRHNIPEVRPGCISQSDYNGMPQALMVVSTHEVISGTALQSRKRYLERTWCHPVRNTCWSSLREGVTIEGSQLHYYCGCKSRLEKNLASITS